MFRVKPGASMRGEFGRLAEGGREVGEAGEVGGEGGGEADVVVGGGGDEFGEAGLVRTLAATRPRVGLAGEGDDGDAHPEGVAGGGVAGEGKGSREMSIG